MQFYGVVINMSPYSHLYHLKNRQNEEFALRFPAFLSPPLSLQFWLHSCFSFITLNPFFIQFYQSTRLSLFLSFSLSRALILSFSFSVSHGLDHGADSGLSVVKRDMSRVPIIKCLHWRFWSNTDRSNMYYYRSIARSWPERKYYEIYFSMSILGCDSKISQQIRNLPSQMYGS